MDIRNKEHLQVLKKKQEELREFKREVKSSAIMKDKQEYVMIDMNEFERLVQDICEPEYLEHVLKYDASEGVQYGILNMRLEERRSKRTW